MYLRTVLTEVTCQITCKNFFGNSVKKSVGNSVKESVGDSVK